MQLGGTVEASGCNRGRSSFRTGSLPRPSPSHRARSAGEPDPLGIRRDGLLRIPPGGSAGVAILTRRGRRAPGAIIAGYAATSLLWNIEESGISAARSGTAVSLTNRGGGKKEVDVRLSESTGGCTQE